MPDAIELAPGIAGRFAEVRGVVAVATGELRSDGCDSDPHNSALGLSVYYYPEEPPDAAMLDAVAREGDARPRGNSPSTAGQLAPRFSQAVLVGVEGSRVDLLWRDLAAVIDGFMACLRGLPGPAYHYDELGCPACLASPIYMAELHYARVFFDRDGVVRALKKLTQVYPERMRDALVGRSLREASLSLQAAAEAAGQSDIHFVLRRLFRSVAWLVQALYALNRRYYVTEKGAVSETDSFPLRPPQFSQTVASLLAIPSPAPECLGSRLDLARALVAAVTALCQAHLEPVAP